MITNIPTPDELTNISLRLYFSVWTNLLSIIKDFNSVFEASAIDQNTWEEAKNSYNEACQLELKSLCAVIQQSNEMALKARICAVSPYLLLLNRENKLSTQQKTIDFFSLRTLDAVDLPATVNTFCSAPLSSKFVEEYHSIRALRNSIVHSGKAKKAFDADKLLRTLVFLYRELWPTRMWLADRVEHAEQTRLAFFHDGRWGSAHAVVMNELPDVYASFTNSDFKSLFGKSKSERRYICHDCSYQATTKGGRPDPDSCRTAWLDDDTHLLCRMCIKTFKIVRLSCKRWDCKGNVIGDNDDDYIGMCHTCGEKE